jgi:phage tail-like protein
MAVLADQPYSGANFLVTIGDADGRDARAGFSEVVFPPFLTDAERERAADAAAVTERRDAGPAPPLLVLRRAVTGSLDLFAWWREAQSGKTPPTRQVTVELLADDHRTVVMTWRFHAAYPVSLTYSPLRAMDGGLVTETLPLRFDSLELA